MKKVLLFNFSGDRLTKVSSAVEAINAKVLLIKENDCGQQLGYLIGTEGYNYNINAPYEHFSDELLIMSGFNRDDINELIQTLRISGAGRVALKAIITPVNINWSIPQLYKAVKADHDEMSRKSKG